jgi:cholesterol transport system auxiliary component
MIPRIHAFFHTIVFVYLVTLSGCSSTDTYVKKYYVLTADRQVEPARTQTEFVLEVCRFTIDSAYSGSGLVYRVGDSEYESDFYNEFLASPSAMITDKTRNWLSRSRLFKRVLDPGSQIDPTYIIEGNITALYGDFRDPSSPKAIIEMRLFLLRAEVGNEPLPVFGKTYTSSIRIESEGPEGLVEALSRCLQGILSTLESDLAERLS